MAMVASLHFPVLLTGAASQGPVCSGAGGRGLAWLAHRWGGRAGQGTGGGHTQQRPLPTPPAPLIVGLGALTQGSEN